MATKDGGDLPAGIPPISMQTICMSGLLVDIYGLEEVPSDATHISVLWLHHARLADKASMREIATRTLQAWHGVTDNDDLVSGSSGSTQSNNPSAADANASTTLHQGQQDRSRGKSRQRQWPNRGFIAAAWDQRNHGTRSASSAANKSWREGNATHAQDMFGIIAGAVADNGCLIDAVAGYLFLDQLEVTAAADTNDGKQQKVTVVDHHIALGVSLGGHNVWQLLWADPRVQAGVAVIGCPDYMALMEDRARLSKLPSYLTQQNGKGRFLGSRDFPPALVKACEALDPRAIMHGTATVLPDVSATEAGAEDRWISVIEARQMNGKRLLSCSGEADKLVPYRAAQPFLKFLENGSTTWMQNCDFTVLDKVYPGVGHTFSPDMMRDSIEFLLDVVVNRAKKMSKESRI